MFLRGERRPTIAWTVGLGLYVLMLGAVYASFDSPEDLQALLENYPEEILDIFGDIGDIGTVSGFLSAELGGYFALVIGIFSVMLMTKHTAGAEERGALDHVLARPITRSEYYWTLLGAGTLIVTVILLGGAVGGMVGFAFADVAATDLLGVLGALIEFLPISLTYLGLGAMLGASFHRRGQANIVGVIVVVAWYAMDVMSRLVEGLDWLAYVTPNGYLGRSELFHGDLDLLYVLFTLGLGAVFAWVGSVQFENKDLYA